MKGAFFDIFTLLDWLTRFYFESALLEMLFGSAGLYVKGALVDVHKDSAPAQVNIIGMANRIFYSSHLSLRFFQL